MKKYNHKSLKKKIYIGMMFSMGVIVILMLPFWYVTNIEVNHNNWYSDDEIQKVCHVENTHILRVSFKELKQSLLALPYIKDASIRYRFPGTIVVNISERRPMGYVPFTGTYLCIDEEGQVIEQITKKEAKMPVIEGLNFIQFKVGERLPIKNEDNLLAAVQIIHALEKYNYEKKVKTIDINNVEQIHLYVDNLDVIIGNIGDFDKKLQWLIEAHKKYDMGVLDLSNIINGQAALSPIT